MSSRKGTKISSRMNKLAGRKVADRDSIQQMCDQPACRKLTSWLETLLQDEALTEQELEKYEEMRAAEIEDLFAEEEVKLPNLRVEKSSLECEIAALEQELLECEERERQLVQQHNILGNEEKRTREVAMRCADRVSPEENLTTAALSKVTQHRFSTQLEALEGMLNTHTAQHSGDAAKYLASQHFDEYIAAELDYTKALGKYCEKLFFPGISQVPGNPRDCKLIENHEEDKENEGNVKIRDTVRRVKGSYVTTQTQNISDSLTVKAVEGKIKAMKDILSDLGEKKYPQDESFLSKLAEESSLATVKLEDDLKLTWAREGVSLLEQLRNLQGVTVLSGDYKIKLARQNYFISRQDKVIDNLLSQLSRQEVLQIMLEHEYTSHRECTELIETILSHISLLNKRVSEQKGLVEGEDAIRGLKSERLTIMNNDSTLNSIIQMLGKYMDGKSHHIFHTFDELTTALCSGTTESRQSSDKAGSSRCRVSGIISELQENLERCSSCLERGFTSTTTEEDKLESAINNLNTLANELKESVDSKTAAASSSDHVSVARNLFVYFFTDPDKINELLHGDP